MNCFGKECKMGEMMKECAGKCKCCAFMCLALGVLAFLLGYFLSPGAVRILWLIASGIGVLMGVLCLAVSFCKK